MLILTGAAGIAYLAWTSGIFADTNPVIAPRLAEQINLERHAHNLAPVQVDGTLAWQAATKSNEVRIAALNYVPGANSDPDATTNVLIIPKVTWALSDTSFRQQFTDKPDNANVAFRNNVLNPEYHMVGIGVSSDSYNYYIVTRWK
ncbi:CAP domain-containing protein [Methanoregula sp.]|uniref:CAP domain-containing protein n=1 Tax=Methanoregula sp. TaxID=2052170 RepID=UPI000CB82ED3|nr:CAP domain-containing protein [Methanoregula sp.]PKG31688.1 MAG: hypothetical protein CW742_12080 [Methanoregula sp.]